jgi:hypothetical protein
VVFSVLGEVSVERKEMAVVARGQATWETGGRGDSTDRLREDCGSGRRDKEESAENKTTAEQRLIGGEGAETGQEQREAVGQQQRSLPQSRSVVADQSKG